MAKKRKKDTAHRVPPLSGIDKTIYAVLSVFLALGIFFLLLGWDWLHGRIAFREPGVVAYRAGLSYLFFLPLLLLIEIGGMIALICLWGGKQPIFGNKKVRYGVYPWKTDLFPMFGSQWEKVRRSASERRFRGKLRRLLLGTIVAFLLLLPLGLFERDCLQEDYTIVEYDMLNRPSAPAAVSDCVRLTVSSIRRTGRYVTSGWDYGFTLYTADGTSFAFSSRDFDLSLGGHKGCLQQMLEIKAMFSQEQITTEGTDRISDLIESCGLNDEETALLQELFRQ